MVSFGDEGEGVIWREGESI